MDELVNVLKNACSQVPKEVKWATEYLKDKEQLPGFVYGLLQISITADVDVSVRWIAVLHLKNCIERRWRPHCPSPISDDEKLSIRNNILHSMHESVPQVYYFTL